LQGAERQVRVPQDLLRFQHLPMLVTFQLEDSQKYGPFCIGHSCQVSNAASCTPRVILAHVILLQQVTCACALKLLLLSINNRQVCGKWFVHVRCSRCNHQHYQQTSMHVLGLWLVQHYEAVYSGQQEYAFNGLLCRCTASVVLSMVSDMFGILQDRHQSHGACHIQRN